MPFFLEGANMSLRKLKKCQLALWGNQQQLLNTQLKAALEARVVVAIAHC